MHGFYNMILIMCIRSFLVMDYIITYIVSHSLNISLKMSRRQLSQQNTLVSLWLHADNFICSYVTNVVVCTTTVSVYSAESGDILTPLPHQYSCDGGEC